MRDEVWGLIVSGIYEVFFYVHCVFLDLRTIQTILYKQKARGKHQSKNQAKKQKNVPNPSSENLKTTSSSSLLYFASV